MQINKNRLWTNTALLQLFKYGTKSHEQITATSLVSSCCNMKDF